MSNQVVKTDIEYVLQRNKRYKDPCEHICLGGWGRPRQGPRNKGSFTGVQEDRYIVVRPREGGKESE